MKSGLLATLILHACLGLANVATQAAVGPASPNAVGVSIVPPPLSLQPIFQFLLSGRFDQNADYRFGFIAGGTFKEDRFELNVEYIMDGYCLTGIWRDRTLTGQWTRTDGSESGQWTAQRPGAILTVPELEGLPALYEWRRADGAVRYALAGTSMAEDWKRAARPLCRVWPAEP